MSLFNVILSLTAVASITASLSGFWRADAAEAGKVVEFYLLEDDAMDFETARVKPLSELALQAKPWIAAYNIERYDWSSHYVYLKQPVAVPNQKGAKYVNLRGKPFVLVASGLRCYLGALWSGVSSYLPSGNVAMVDVWGDQIERFQIKLFSALKKGEPRTEMRNHPMLEETLKRQGIFHAGLECTLDKLSMDRKEGVFTIDYTYTLHNQDQDDLYVLDPEKFPTVFFHDFRNGVIFAENVETGEIIRWPNPRTSKPEPVAKKELSWYSRLKKGESMTRTVTMAMDALPSVKPEPGKYMFYFRFTGYEPVNNSQLQLKINQVRLDADAADGRIWLGELSLTNTRVWIHN